MIVVIQALVILFTGALENMVRMPVERALPALRRAEAGLMDLETILAARSTRRLRLATPLLLACLAGLYSERAGIFDIGLEGKMLAAAFAAAAVAAVTGSAWLGLLAGIAPRCAARAAPRPRLDHPQGQPADLGRRDQLAGLGPDRAPRPELVRPGRPARRSSSGAQRFRRIDLPFADDAARRAGARADLPDLISGHNILVYVALLAVPLTWWVLYRTRFGLRLRAVGENPGGRRHRRHLGRRGCAIAAVIIAGCSAASPAPISRPRRRRASSAT